MARIRSIHPGLASDEAFMTMSMAAKAAWSLLWTECDDNGVFEWKPIVLKARIFPAESLNFAEVLSEYEALGCVMKVEVEGKPYGFIRNFCRYQRPKSPSYRFPLPECAALFVGKSGNPTPVLPQSSPSPTEIVPQMKEEGGSRKEDTASAASSARGGLTYDQIEDQCRKAAGLETDPSPSLLDLSPINQLLAKGADLERDILPVIRAKAKGGVRSWRFFVPAIVEAMTPAAGLSGIKPSAPPVPDEDRWSRSLLSHSKGNWSDHWGPEPGRPGCQIPDAFVAKWRRENGLAEAA